MCDLPRSRSDVGLPDGFQGINSLRVFLLHLHHFTETALPDDLEQIELVDGERFMTGRFEIDFEVERA